MKGLISKKIPDLFHFLVLATYSLVILIIYKGTGLESDSINHYLYARYAVNHPELYLNHWAKPLFTLLASPFAQFGFIGVKVFNTLCSLVTAFLLIKISRKLKLSKPWLSAYFYFLLPLSYLIFFSGLTEALCALFISASIYMICCKRLLAGIILISFSPFIRSEGLIIIAVFGLYLLWVKEYKKIPWLFFGHLIYSIVGFFYYEDILWVFTKIPYANLGSPYGSGRILHFADQLIYVTGIPLLILFLLGLIRSIQLKINNPRNFNLEFFLFTGLFLAFFIAHSLFWYLGIFNSMGLKRVLGSVSPLIAVLALLGFNWMEKATKLNKYLKVIPFLILIYVLIFPFTSNPAAVDWDRDLSLSPPQEMALEMAHKIDSLGLSNSRFVFADPYLSEALNLDPFDEKERLFLNPENLVKAEPGDFIIWENWNARIDSGYELEYFSNRENFEEVLRLENYDHSRPVIYVLIQKTRH